MKKDSDKFWIGVDLDRTLSIWGMGDDDLNKIGDPIPLMLNRVKKWLNEGKIVKIFTARFDHGQFQVDLIHKWLQKHNLPKLEVTNVKDRYCRQIWDDRAVRVKENVGEIDNSFKE